MSSTSAVYLPPRLVIGLAAAVIVLLTGAGVQAQDGGFFEQLFGMQPRQPAPAAAPSYASQGSYGGSYRRARRHARDDRRGRLRTRYVALPRADQDPDRITGKQPVDQKAIQDNPAGALLRDDTLRAGDIVVMPEGPRVFRGAPGKRHRLSDFEDVKHSRMVDAKTRALLIAMMVPVGAMPADQARKVMAARRRLAPPGEIAAVEARNAADTETQPLRMIVPWREKN